MLRPKIYQIMTTFIKNVENVEYVENDNLDFVETSCIDENSLRYFLGFCMKKLKNCSVCQEYFQKQNKTDLMSSSECFNLQKNYNFNNMNLFLRAPCDDLFESSKKWARIFQNHFFNSPSRFLIKLTI